MVFICVICTVKEPPLLPMNADHRKLLEAIVSPVINTMEYKSCQLLHCVDCRFLLQSVQNFQETALRGMKAFTQLLTKDNDPVPLGIIKPVPELKQEKVPIKYEEDRDTSNFAIDSLSPIGESTCDTVEVKVEIKPEPDSGSDTASTISCDSVEILDSMENPNKAAGTDSQKAGSSDSQKAGSSGSQKKASSGSKKIRKHYINRVAPRIRPNANTIGQVRVYSEKPVQNSQMPTQARKLVKPLMPVPGMKVMSDKPTQSPLGKLATLAKNVTSRPMTGNVKMPKGESFDVYTHKTTHVSGQSSLRTPPVPPMPKDSQDLMTQEFKMATTLPYLTSIRWKDGVEDGTIKRKKKRYTPKPASCPHCNKCLSSKSSLGKHIRDKHADPVTVECKTCGKQCSGETALKTHMLKHKMEGKTIDDLDPHLFCQECGIYFQSPSMLKNHLLTLKHTPREKYAYECETCQRKFPTEYRRQEHINVVHLNQRHYKCDACGKGFAKASYLRTHLAKAHDLLPRPKRRAHICHICGKNFTVIKSLREHLLSHEGLRPFQCQLCPASFSYKAVLYNHNKLKHLKIKGKWKKKKKAGKESAEVGKELTEVGKDSGEVGKELMEVGKDSGEVGKESIEVEELENLERAHLMDIDSFLN